MRRLFEFAIRLRLMVLMLTGCALWAQEPVKRLESVRIDPQELKLTWTVTEGTEDADEKFTATTWREFSIDLDKATMEELTLAQSDAFREFPKHNRKTDEVREFAQREADSVLRLVAILARYAADSTEWWDLGMGRKKPEGRIAVDTGPALVRLRNQPDGEDAVMEYDGRPKIRWGSRYGRMNQDGSIDWEELPESVIRESESPGWWSNIISEQERTQPSAQCWAGSDAQGRAHWVPCSPFGSSEGAVKHYPIPAYK